MFPTFLLKINYIYLINHLKINIAKRNYFFDIKVTSSVRQMLYILHSLGIIRRFCRLRENLYRIYPTWSSASSASRHIKVYSHTKNPLKIKIKALRVLKKSTGCSNLILNTPKGIITHQQALRLNTGGHLLCVIY